MLLDVHAESARYAQRRLDDLLKPVDNRLHEWGVWARKSGVVLGWPSRTTLGRVIEEGYTGAAYGAQPVSMPPEIAEVDAAVATIPGRRHAVLLISYVYCPALPAEYQRRQLRVGRHEWRGLLRDGRLLVAQQLGCFGELPAII